MAATPSIKIIKTMPVRGEVRRWSNRYHFNGGTPANGTAWETLRANVVAAEVPLYDARSVVVEAHGYAAGSELPVFSWTGSVPGTFTGTGSRPQAADCVGIIRYATAARTSKNHPVYLFNYYHCVFNGDGTGDSQWDEIFGSQHSRYQTFGGLWESGFSDGTNTYNRAGPNGASATGVFVSPYIFHRDFPR